MLGRRPCLISRTCYSGTFGARSSLPKQLMCWHLLRTKLNLRLVTAQFLMPLKNSNPRRLSIGFPTYSFLEQTGNFMLYRLLFYQSIRIIQV